jgi:hypothetical protein
LIRKKGQWLVTNLDGELVMMGVEDGRYLGVNAMGARIFALIDTPCSLQSICEHLVAEFDVTPDVCRAEVVTFLGELVRFGAASLERDAFCTAQNSCDRR